MRFVLLNLITFLLISGCAEPILDLANKNLAAMTQANLVQFGSNENFKHYLAALQKAQPSKKNIPNGALASTSEAAADSSGSITNNQELGVDEGDIVKKMGDYLIVLRRGRLFSLNLDNLAPIHNIDTFPEGSSGQGTWYDEILTNDNKIIVIGYSYNVSATEIGIFDLSDSGELSHNQTFYLRSNDYYSSRNYASRLVDGKLIFYMPYSFISHDFDDNLEITLPAQATRNANGRVNNWDNIIDTSNIFMPIQETNYPVMHSVITC